MIAPLGSVNYFKSVVEFNDKHVHPPEDPLRDTLEFFRLFMTPGVGHCSGGPGLKSFGQNGGSGPAESDMFSALEKWVEENAAPDKIIATGGTPANTFTRSLCPYPQKAQYMSGDPTKAGSFLCANDPER